MWQSEIKKLRAENDRLRAENTELKIFVHAMAAAYYAGDAEEWELTLTAALKLAGKG
mgnify:CR=1 FL=1